MRHGYIAEFIEKEVYQPLGMDHTAFTPPKKWEPRIAPTQKRSGHWLRGRVHDPRAARMNGVAGHAGLFTPAGDLARFCRMILQEGKLNGTRVFKRSTVDRWTRPRYPSSGLEGRTYGFDVTSGYDAPRGERFPRHFSFGHSGFTGVMLWIDPLHEAFVILLTNRLHVARHSTVDLYRKVSTDAATALLGPGPDPNRVLSGIDKLEQREFAPVAERKVGRIGLICNHTGRDALAGGDRGGKSAAASTEFGFNCNDH